MPAKRFTVAFFKDAGCTVRSKVIRSDVTRAQVTALADATDPRLVALSVLALAGDVAAWRKCEQAILTGSVRPAPRDGFVEALIQAGLKPAPGMPWIGGFRRTQVRRELARRGFQLTWTLNGKYEYRWFAVPQQSEEHAP